MAANSTNSSIAVICLISPNFDQHDNLTNLPYSVQPTWLSFCIVNGIAAPPTFVVNLLIIWTVLEDENFRSVSYNLLLAALAVTDLLTGLVVEPLFVWLLNCRLSRCASLCQKINTYALALLTCSCLTLCTLMMASVERYLAIEHPNFYRTKITTKKMMIAMLIVSLWIAIPMVLILSRILLDDNDALRKIPYFVMVASNALIILFCTIKVQVTAYRQRRAIAIQQAAVQQEEQQNRLQEYKRAFTMSMLVLATVLFYCPYIISMIIEAIKGKGVTDDFKYISKPIFLTFVHLQSLINPLIMSLRLSYIRQGVKKKLPCLNGKS